MTLYFATTPKGLEPVLMQELSALGAREVSPERGGVYFQGDLALALRANLWLRSAMRVLEPVAENLPARTAAQLYEAARALPWHERLSPQKTIAVSAHGKTEGLIHTHFTALKIKDAIVDQLRDARGSRPSVHPTDPDVHIIAHLADERATLYLDLSGQSLHRRGYRVAQTEAPLKEPIAAALLLWAGWDGQKPFFDPMCGSGTFAIEAALIALGRAPNAERRFGIERWPGFGQKGAALLKSLRAEARGEGRLQAPLFASDISERALKAARANAGAAGVLEHIRFSRRDAREITPLSPPGLVAINPPYGERLGETGRLRALYQDLGARLRSFAHHEVLFLTGALPLARALKMVPKKKLRVYNGPIECLASLFEVWEKPEAPRPGKPSI